MNREQVMEWAREYAEQQGWIAVHPGLAKSVLAMVEHVAGLVAAAERESCAKVCDAIADVGKDDKSIEGNLLSGCLSTAAQAIRARNTNKETKLARKK